MFEYANCFPEFFADKVGRASVCLGNASPTRFDWRCEEQTRKEHHRPVIRGHAMDLQLPSEVSKFWEVMEQSSSFEKMNLQWGSTLNWKRDKTSSGSQETHAVGQVWVMRAFLGAGIRSTNKDSGKTEVGKGEWLHER